MNLLISYKNGTSDSFVEKQIDCSRWTIRGHASNIVDALINKTRGFYKLDNYNAICLDEIVSVRVNAN